MDAVLENALQNSEDLGDDEPFPYGNALVSANKSLRD